MPLPSRHPAVAWLCWPALCWRRPRIRIQGPEKASISNPEAGWWSVRLVLARSPKKSSWGGNHHKDPPPFLPVVYQDLDLERGLLLIPAIIISLNYLPSPQRLADFAGPAVYSQDMAAWAFEQPSGNVAASGISSRTLSERAHVPDSRRNSELQLIFTSGERRLRIMSRTSAFPTDLPHLCTLIGAHSAG